MTEDFCLQPVDIEFAEDIKADVRMQMFFVLKQALRDRRLKCEFTSKQLAEAIGKDEGYVSKIVSGKSRGITAETLAVFMAALKCHVTITAEKLEILPRSNHHFTAFHREVKPANLVFSSKYQTNMTLETKTQNTKTKKFAAVQ